MRIYRSFFTEHELPSNALFPLPFMAPTKPFTMEKSRQKFLELMLERDLMSVLSPIVS